MCSAVVDHDRCHAEAAGQPVGRDRGYPVRPRPKLDAILELLGGNQSSQGLIQGLIQSWSRAFAKHVATP
jgi:hypothetical protein